MRMSSLSTVVPVLFALAVSTAACSGGGSGSPLSPSTPAPAAAASATTTADASQSAVSANEVEVTGRITETGTGSITLGSLNLTIVVPASAVITRGGSPRTAADLVTGLLVEVKAVRSGAVVTATRVNIEDETPGTGTGTGVEPGEDLELTGTLTAPPTGTCPAVSFVLGTTTITTNATTRFDDLTCGSLAVGDTLRVEGVRQSNGSVLASEVNRSNGSTTDDDDDDDDDRDDSRQEVDITGSLSARPAGSCPVVTFTLSGSTVVTSGTTRFDDVSCANLSGGDSLRVKGVRQSNGSIAASEVKKIGGSSGSGSNSGSGSSGGNSGSGSSGSGSSGSGSSGSGR